MKKWYLALFLVFCMVGVVWAAAPNPLPSNISGGGWVGSVRTPDGVLVPLKVVVTSQAFNRLSGSLTLGAQTLNEAKGMIDGNNFYMDANDGAGHYIHLSGALTWLPSARLYVTYIYNQTSSYYGDSILTPTATP